MGPSLDLHRPTIFYAVDTDNDGVPDANYIDLGFPLMTTPDGTSQFVAMAAIRIIDADRFVQSQRERQPGRAGCGSVAE